MEREDGTHVIEASTPLQVVTERAAPTMVLTEARIGPPGRDGADGSVGRIISFAFGDATPKALDIAQAGKRIYSVGIHIFTPFDGAGAALAIGSAFASDELLAPHQVAPGEVGQFEVYPDAAYVSNTQLYLSITPGDGASQGAGQVLIVIEP